MFRALICASLVVVACGGDGSSGSTIGTIPPTTTTRIVTTTTTTIPEPAALDQMVIPINRMPEGWVLVDDMSGEIGLTDIDAALREGLSDVGILNAYRTTFARSATSEVGALARSGAELIVSIAVEMEDEEAATAGVETLIDALGSTTRSSQTIRTPGPGHRVELTGGVFVMAWSIDAIVQILVANGVPATNIVNVADLVPDVN